MRHLSKFFGTLLLLAGSSTLIPSKADPVHISGPDGKVTVEVKVENSVPTYCVKYNSVPFIMDSPLGFISDAGDYSKATTVSLRYGKAYNGSYSLPTIKKKDVTYKYTESACTFTTTEGKHFDVIFRVGDNDVAFRYAIPRETDKGGIFIREEKTAFAMSPENLSFVNPQSDAMVGWKRTKPSYEEEYRVGLPVSIPSRYGHGYTFPCLFQMDGGEGWILIGETGVDSRYCGSRLSDYEDGMLSIAFPMEEENSSIGHSGAALSLPGVTPWRTITLGDSLKPIVETTVTWDMVEPRYKCETPFTYGPGVWSWILWDDASINMTDQKTYVDLAHDLGYKTILVDNNWDKNIGRDNIPELVQYAAKKKVGVFLWYSSSGYWNDISQSPTDCMDDPVRRRSEMHWLRDMGVCGIKVDFFGGDKQETMRLYEEILLDAAEAGLMVIFHGCTMPRGWERMYPNYVGSEAVLASENLRFSADFCKREAQNATLHPFVRNALGCMEYGGTFLNNYYNKANSGGHRRITSDVFQCATAILFQNPIQNFALAPNNLKDADRVLIDFMKDVPTTWDETVFIDGYPGKYIVLGRRSGKTWYIAAVNGSGEALDLEFTPPMFSKKQSFSYLATPTDGEKLRWKKDKAKEGAVSFLIPNNDAVIIQIPGKLL